MSKFQYSEASKAKIATCHPQLQAVANRVIELTPYDITIVWGFRNKEQQDRFQSQGASEKRWPDSKHNNMGSDGRPLSLAIDFAPVIGGAIPWTDTHIFAAVAGVFYAASVEVGVRLRFGMDWDMDGSTKDQKLMDYGHVEIIL